jgi:hypothetical protein
LANLPKHRFLRLANLPSFDFKGWQICQPLISKVANLPTFDFKGGKFAKL